MLVISWEFSKAASCILVLHRRGVCFNCRQDSLVPGQFEIFITELFNTYLLSTYQVPGTVLDPGSKALKETDDTPHPIHGSYSVIRGKQYKNPKMNSE